jgi:hypothetical protein
MSVYLLVYLYKSPHRCTYLDQIWHDCRELLWGGLKRLKASMDSSPNHLISQLLPLHEKHSDREGNVMVVKMESLLRYGENSFVVARLIKIFFLLVRVHYSQGVIFSM